MKPVHLNGEDLLDEASPMAAPTGSWFSLRET